MEIKIFNKVLTFKSKEIISTANTKPSIDIVSEAVVDTVEGPKEVAIQPKALTGTYRTFYTHSFTGEKNLGEIGPIKVYAADHDALRARSWQLYLESEICQIVFGRMARWVIGTGLKLQCEPSIDVLKSEKITLDSESFNDITEDRFYVYADSKMSDYSGMVSLHKLADRVDLNANISGDCLVILRYENNQVKVQLIDGSCVGTPYSCSFNKYDFIWPSTGNAVRHGVEVDKKGKHIAYHVRTSILDYERIDAVGAKSGMVMAFLYYGLEYRLDSVRGIPLISAVMETAKKMDRYKEATLGSAEEGAKMVLSIEHDVTSSGENPLLEALASANGISDQLPLTVDGEQLANKVAATTNKQAINMPVGAKLNPFESKKELYFGDFFSVNIGLVCATVGIPKDVAMMQFDSNYSASRAALKDWEHTLTVKRKRSSDQFYQPVYNFWLTMQVLTNKIQAPGYMEAIATKNEMAVEAYRTARWVGANVPHIDPLKEVMAERLKLGSSADHLPLTTVEAATESLNGGDSEHNFKQFANESATAEKLGIEAPEVTAPALSAKSSE